VTVTIPPRAPEIEDERSVEERVAELEALIKEARRRARRRRAAYAAVALVALAGVVAGAAGIGGGGDDIDGSVAHGSPPPAPGPHTFQVNPKHPNIVYASALGDDTHEGGVYKSTDAGKTWSLADTGLSNPSSPTDSEDLRVDALALDPRSPDVLYAGTGLGVFKTTDGAKTWKRASTGIYFYGDSLYHRMLEGWVYEIVIDPMHTSTVHATGRTVYPTGPRYIWKSTDGGGTWHRLTR
jgi:hypothetical protein